MNIWDRIILAIYTLFMIGVSLLTFICSLNLFSPRYIGSVVAGIPGSYTYMFGSLLLMVVGGRLLFANLKPPKSMLVLKEGDNGKLEVKKTAIESYTDCLAEAVDGVYNARTKVEFKQEGIYVRIHANVETDARIPDLEKAVQTNVREGLFNATGVQVCKVDWVVKNIRDMAEKE